MRAVVFSFTVLVACGGRTLDDGTFDDVGGDSGSGGSSSGARSGSGSGARAGSGSGARPGDGSGGAPGVAGSPSPGGSFGGTPSGGRAGGSTGTAGAAGGGGAVVVPMECSNLCSSYSLACGQSTIDDRSCQSACAAGFAELDPSCYPSRALALGCVAKAYASSPMRCESAEQLAALACFSELEAANRCGTGCFGSSIAVSPNACWLSQDCPQGLFELKCTADATGQTRCECTRDSEIWFSFLSPDLRTDSACSDPDLMAACGGS